MKVFISYGDAADQVTALRLQALGAVNGLTVYVPPAHTRQAAAGLLDPEGAQKLSDAEVVLGVVGDGLTEACRQELKRVWRFAKNMIVMAYPMFEPQLQPYFGSNLVGHRPTESAGSGDRHRPAPQDAGRTAGREKSPSGSGDAGPGSAHPDGCRSK